MTDPKNEPEPSFAEKQYSRLFAKMETIDQNQIDSIANVASTLCEVPICNINFLEGGTESFKYKYGLDVHPFPDEESFCAKTLSLKDIHLVEDSSLDPEFANSKYVLGEPHVGFYAGIPLITKSNECLGTICVIGHKPKKLSAAQLASLKTLASHIIAILELRHAVIKTKLAKDQLLTQNESLMSFAYNAAHDIKSPLGNIIQLSKTIEKDDRVDLEEARSISNLVSTSALKLNSIIDGILNFSKKTSFNKEDIEEINIKSFFKEGISYAKNQANIHFETDVMDDLTIHSNRNAMERIMVNLVVNAIKYCDKEISKIVLSARAVGDFITFGVKDNGLGISERDQAKIFKLFQTTTNVDKQGKKGTGIGLSTVLSLVEQLGGSMEVNSEVGKGSTFSFTLPQNHSF